MNNDPNNYKALKSALFALATLIVFSMTLGHGQIATDPGGLTNQAPGVSVDTSWHNAAVDGSTTEWRRTELVTNAVTGVVSTQLHRYLEVSSGLNFLDSNGVWQASVDAIRLMTNGGGAAALRGQTKAYFSPALGGSEPTLSLVSAGGTTVNIAPVAVYYVDDATGQSVLLGSVKDGAEGELVGQNQVVYRGALQSGLKADIRYTYTHGACESDLIILSQPIAPPETYSLSPATTRLEFVHLVTAPLPNAIPAANVNGLADVTLDYDSGGLLFPQGYAFSTGDTNDTNVEYPTQPVPIVLPSGASGDGRLPVAKQIISIGSPGQWGLAESVRWLDIKPQLEALPAYQQGAHLSTPLRHASSKRELPVFNKRTAQNAPKPMKVASAVYDPKGVLLDWISVNSGSTYWFSNNITYYVSSLASFTSTVTFDTNCIIKFANNASLYLTGPVTCKGTSAGPSILTSINDWAFGEKVTGGTGLFGYSASPAIRMNYNGAAQTLNYMKIRWAQTGVEFDQNGTLANSSLEWCLTGVYATNYSITLSHSTKCSLSTPTSGGGTFTGSLNDICNGNDSNGLPFSWEYKWFGQTGVSLTADPDGDGLNNQTEYNDNTDPQVSDLPQIQGQPQNMTVARGNPATFAVAATGTGTLTYQWLKDGFAISGGTNSTFTLTNVQLGDCANYSVIITNTVGSLPLSLTTTSSNAFLSVATPTNGVPLPPGAVAWWKGENNALDSAGTNNGSWTNQALYATGEVNTAFYFNGTNNYVQVPDASALELTNTMTIEFWVERQRINSAISEYVIEKGGDWFAGSQQNYAVQIHAPDNGLCLTWDQGYRIAGAITNTSSFHHCAIVATNGTANPAIYIDGVQQSIFSSYGGNINLVASTRALHLGAQIDPTSGYNYYGNNIVDEMTLYNRGLYASEIQEIYNGGAGGKYPITNSAPSITSQPTNVTVAPLGSATFSVTATGSAPLYYQWQLNGNPISGATSSSYSISSCGFANAGIYTVVVANTWGSVLSSNATLTVTCASAPTNMISWWRAEGDATDAVGGNDGKLVAGTSFTTGEVGQGFNNQFWQFVKVPSSPSLNLTNNFTVEFWYKDTGVEPYWVGLVGKCSPTAYNFNIQLLANTNITMSYWDPITANNPSLAYPAPTANAFHHVAATYSQQNATSIQMQMYIDGILKTNGTYSGNLTNTLNSKR